MLNYDDLHKENLVMTTKFNFFKSSAKAKTIDADGAKAQIGAEKYPWRTLPEGESFFINTKEHVVKLSTIQSAASRWSKKLNRKFRAVKWEEDEENNIKEGIEVARLPDKPSVGTVEPEKINGLIGIFDEDK